MDEFRGGVFSDELPGGRAGATLHVGGAGLEGTTAEDRRFVIPLHELQLEQGGASGRMLFCRNAERSVCLFSEERGLLRSLEDNGGRIVAEQVAELRKRMGGRRRRGLLIAGSALALLVAAILSIPLVLSWASEGVVASIPPSFDERIGESAIEGMEIATMDCPVAQEAIDVIVARLDEALDEEQRGWNFSFQIAESAELNAFALPGGPIVVYSGLILASEDAEELAAVLAHEMGHVIHRHGVERLVDSAGIVIGMQLLLGDVGGLAALAADVFTIGALNAYSRSQEREADVVAVHLLHRAGLDSLALARFFERLEEQYGSLPEYMQLMSTHPSHAERIEAVSQHLAGLPEVPRRALDLDWAAVQAALREAGAPEPATTPASPEPQ